MEYTNKESFIKRLWNKFKNSTIASIFNNNIDVPSSDAELYKQITSEEGLSIEEAKKIEASFRNANESLTNNIDENDSKFRVKGINPKAYVSEKENLSRPKGGREHVE